MKVGDLVKLKTEFDWPTGVIVDIDPSGWFWVLQSDGQRRIWPASHMELLFEGKLK